MNYLPFCTAPVHPSNLHFPQTVNTPVYFMPVRQHVPGCSHVRHGVDFMPPQTLDPQFLMAYQPHSSAHVLPYIPQPVMTHVPLTLSTTASNRFAGTTLVTISSVSQPRTTACTAKVNAASPYNNVMKSFSSLQEQFAQHQWATVELFKWITDRLPSTTSASVTVGSSGHSQPAPPPIMCDAGGDVTTMAGALAATSSQHVLSVDTLTSLLAQQQAAGVSLPQSLLGQARHRIR